MALLIYKLIIMDYKTTFSEIYAILKTVENPGKVAQYIPELKNIKASKFGVSITDISGKTSSFKDAEELFSIQSIVKVLSLILAYKEEDEQLWKRLGVEPSGSAFNSLVQLEYEKGIPRNPFINSGALVICDVLLDILENPKKDFLKFIHQISGDTSINYNKKIAASEKSCAYTNTALINLMRAYGNINNKISKVMDFYFHICSIEMSCLQLSRTFLFLANNGICPIHNNKIINPNQSKRINAIMLTCGFYDEAGEFAFSVGLPGKSGVGGGIIAIRPEKYSIAVWSPKLNKKGNSFLGTKFLEAFTTITNSSIF